jgi:hypothetical protein
MVTQRRVAATLSRPRCWSTKGRITGRKITNRPPIGASNSIASTDAEVAVVRRARQDAPGVDCHYLPTFGFSELALNRSSTLRAMSAFDFFFHLHLQYRPAAPG